MKNSAKENYADKVLDFVDTLDETLTDKEKRNILSYAYKQKTKSITPATKSATAKKTTTAKKKK